MFLKKSKLAKRTYLALSLTTAMVAVYQPNLAQAESFGSKIVDAVEANSAEQVSTLLDKGINPNERGQFGTSALLRAANNGNLEIAKILISKGANANVADLGGATALHIAARKGDFALVDFLLKNKADVNLADKEGNTALMLAAISGSQPVVDALIAQGAQVDATNNSGETALLYATDNSAEKIVDTLVAAGAKNDVIDEEGFSIKEVAQRKNNEVLVAKLDARDSNHVVIEMGRGFRSISSVEKERQEIAQAERESGEQLIAKLDKRDLVDYSAEYMVEPSGKVDFIDDPELAMLDTPNFAQIEPSSGASGKAEQPKSTWLAGLKKSFESAGAFELASVKNFAEGKKYAILELGSFKVKAFAEKRISELQMDNMDVLSDVQLVIFERGTGANLEYLVNGGIFETKTEADSICQKLVARGVRCNPVETAMITNDQFAKFNAPVKSEYSAPAVEKADIGADVAAIKIPEMPKTEAMKTAAVATLPAAPVVKTLAKVEAKPELKPSSPVVDGKSIAANSFPATSPAPAIPVAKVAPVIAAVATLPTPPAAPVLKTLAKVEAKPELKPASPVVDAKSIAANTTSSTAPKNLAASTPTAPAVPTPAAPAQVKPEIAAIKTVEAEDENLSLLARAGMVDVKDDAKKPVEKSTIDSIVDSIYSEKEAATAKAPMPVATPVATPAVKTPEKAIVAQAAPQKLENVEDVKKQIESLPTLDAKISSAPAVTMPKLEEKIAPAPAVLAAKEPLKIVFADSRAAEAVSVIAPVTQAPSIVASENLSAKGERIAEFRIANNATVKPELVQQAPAIQVAPTPKLAPETISIPATPVLAPVKAEVSAPAPVDKFIVAKPLRVDDARIVAPAPQAQFLADPAYTNAAPVVTYNNAYIPPVHTFNRRENRRMVQVDYFATPTAAQGLYWKYREAGMLGDYTTVRATKGILSGAHYSALIGEFSSSAEAQAFCNTVYKAEKLRCKIQDEIDYTSSPRLTGVAKSYQRHSSNTVNVGGLSRHSSR